MNLFSSVPYILYCRTIFFLTNPQQKKGISLLLRHVPKHQIRVVEAPFNRLVSVKQIVELGILLAHPFAGTALGVVFMIPQSLIDMCITVILLEMKILNHGN